MKIKMDVELLNEKCVNCKDLEIDVVTKTFTGLDAYDDDPEVVKKDFSCTNELRCAHFQDCRWRYEHVMQEEKKAEIKVLKKPTEKKTTVKKETVKKVPAVTPAKKKATAVKTTKTKAAAKK